MMLLTTLILAVAFRVSAGTKNIVRTTVVDDMRIELTILPAEPFFTSDEVAQKNVKEGMLIIGGAEPLSPEADMHPSHHLVVHVLDAKTGKAITAANVTMSFQHLDAKRKPIGESVNVPVVIMQAIGKGTESTHYGNNVVMPPGFYSINLAVDGKKASFRVIVPGEGSKPSDAMHMH
jgi:hypothetical protein